MNKQQAIKFEEQGRKLDRILAVLAGDELGQYPGLIAEQKKDNEFRVAVKADLEAIKKAQDKQIKINEDVHLRIKNLEAFAAFFQTVGQVKKKTWFILGGIMAGFGFILVKLQNFFKWIQEFWSNLS